MKARSFSAVLKDMTVADAHVATALGNEGGPGKKQRKAPLAEVGKDAGPRSLKGMDEANSHVPFPHDANALGQLRDDQVPRFLGALTDPSALPTKDVALSGLTAIQNRVETGKVEALRGGKAKDKKAVVVRMNGRDYIADGHHRLTADYLDGADKSTVHYLDLSGVSNAVKRGPAFSIPIKVAKALPDQQMIFGWASVVEKNGQLIIDKQDDVIPVHELEGAVYDFMLDARDHGTMHDVIGTGRCIESMMFTLEKQKILDIVIKDADGHQIVAWWAGFKVDNPAVWELHKAGKLPEFSIGGTAVPVEV